MKKNVPKFLIAKNEAASPGAAYIVHTQEPSFIAEIKTFSNINERDNYLTDNEDKEVIIIDRIRIIEIKKYLESNDHEKRRSYLDKKIVHWVIANYLNSSVF